MESLVTQNVMHASLCHMTSVGTGGTGGRDRWGDTETGWIGEGGKGGGRAGGEVGDRWVEQWVDRGTGEGDRRGRKVENRRGGDMYRWGQDKFIPHVPFLLTGSTTIPAPFCTASLTF